MNLTQLYTQLIAALTKLRDTLINVQETNVKLSLLEKFCLAIRDYEGAPGDANYRNNNPGNCRYSDIGYLPKYEPVSKSPDGFAIFPSMAIGMLYLENLVREKVANHPEWTIMQFIQNYAPTSDGNDPALYAAFIARRLSVGTDYLMTKIIA